MARLRHLWPVSTAILVRRDRYGFAFVGTAFRGGPPTQRLLRLNRILTAWVPHPWLLRVQRFSCIIWEAISVEAALLRQILLGLHAAYLAESLSPYFMQRSSFMPARIRDRPPIPSAPFLFSSLSAIAFLCALFVLCGESLPPPAISPTATLWANSQMRYPGTMARRNRF